MVLFSPLVIVLAIFYWSAAALATLSVDSPTLLYLSRSDVSAMLNLQDSPGVGSLASHAGQEGAGRETDPDGRQGEQEDGSRSSAGQSN